MTDDITRETTVEKTEDYTRFRSKIKRGSGVRDEEEHVVETRRQNVDDAIEAHAAGIVHLENQLANECAQIQPDRPRGDGQ